MADLLTEKEGADNLRAAIESNDVNQCTLLLRIILRKNWDINSLRFAQSAGLEWRFLQHAIIRCPGVAILRCLVQSGADANYLTALRDAVLWKGEPEALGEWKETFLEGETRKNTPLPQFDTEEEAVAKLQRVRYLVEEGRADLSKQGAAALDLALYGCDFCWSSASPKPNALVTYLIRDCGLLPNLGHSVIRVMPDVASQQRLRVIFCLASLEQSSRLSVNLILEFLFTAPAPVLPRYKAWVQHQIPAWCEADALEDVIHFSDLHSWYKHVNRPWMVYPALMWGRQPSGNIGNTAPTDDGPHWWFFRQHDEHRRVLIAQERYDCFPSDVWALMTKFPILLTRNGLNNVPALSSIKAMWEQLANHSAKPDANE